jgi:DNA mismatch repair protein MutS2
MAKVGLYVPAKEPVLIPWFEKILADIGDEQSLEQNLSTFSGHIRRISRILGVIPTDLSPYAPILVLLDEVGAGTDPIEGTALAIALLQSLAAQVQLTLATTHYGELKALKYQDQRFENASVEFNDQTLSPTYRLLWGIPGRSNALAIAQRLGLRADIVQRAQGRLGQEAANVNEVIAGLEQQRREQERKAQQAQKLLQEAEIFHAELLMQSRALRQQERQLQQHQQQAVQAAIDSAKAEIAQVIRQLQRGQPSAQKAHQATMQLEQIINEQKAPPPPSQNNYIPQMGERVRIPSLGQTATVVSLEKSQGEVTVKLGLMKMTLPMIEVESLDGKKVAPPEVVPPPPPATTSRTPILLRSEKNTLDLRGARVEEAESQLEAAIAKAQDFDVLWIIHGKGTGRLRQGVQDFLSHHPQIQSFQLAPAAEGGAGVTIAYFRN